MTLRRGIGLLLIPFSLIWGVVAGMRRLFFEITGRRQAVGTELGVTTWVIGNITVGGTGKTPLMIALCRRIMEKGNGMRLGVLSRGYGREDRRYGFQWVDSRVPGAVGLYGDEPVEIQRALAEYGEGIEVAVCGDRVEGVRRMVTEKGLEVLLLDDGMQHLPLRADGYVMVVDFNRQPQDDFCMPGGNLREFGFASEKVSWVVVNKCSMDVLEGEKARLLKQRLSPYLKKELRDDFENRVLLTYEQVHSQWVLGDDLEDKAAFGLLGIASGERILRNWKNIDKVVGGLVFGDHHLFTREEMEGVLEQMRIVGAERLITTRKDWMRLDALLDNGDGSLRKEFEERGIAIEIQWTEPAMLDEGEWDGIVMALMGGEERNNGV